MSYSPYAINSPSTMQAGGECMGIRKVEDLEHKCALWRYRCTENEIRDLEHVNSKYSDEFIVADVPWRVHLQQRTDPQTNVLYLAVHLQCVHTQQGGTYGHFKLTICNRENEKSKGKNFHCHFKKPGSAWGLHHFIQMDRLLGAEGGFTERFEDPSSGQVIPCVVIDVLLKVIDPGLDGTYVIGQLPKPTRVLSAVTVNAKLQWPVDREADLYFQFASGGQPLAAHRCVVQARCPKLMEQEERQEDASKLVVNLPEHMTRDVFEMFLRFVYTEEGPEGKGAGAHVLIDLYRLASDAEYYTLAEKCLLLAAPLVSAQNVLELISTRHSDHDEPLNIVFLRVLAAHYDQLIEDPSYEEIPGKLNRKLQLVMRGKETLGDVRLPHDQGRTLSNDLGNLVRHETYADIDVMLPGSGQAIRLHKVVLQNRAVACSKWQGPTYEFPNDQEYCFSDESYRAFFAALYRGTLESTDGSQVTPELIALTLKMDEDLQLTGDLRKECDAWVSPQNCLPLYVLSQRHNVMQLSETSKALLARSFMDKMRSEPDHVWQLLNELPRDGVLSLFKSFANHMLDAQPQTRH
eukprot:TRINITY_DN3990_c0_g1_i1.p1 TRINITY_DN3990_c0_g1~~TRINITY_DN3990_c0_g1_i1.p1  ORF type:complete len:576 (+),score=221.00 TRINITY_DN3990_c0_g1_i1:75-1802(+)